MNLKVLKGSSLNTRNQYECNWGHQTVGLANLELRGFLPWHGTRLGQQPLVDPSDLDQG